MLVPEEIVVVSCLVELLVRSVVVDVGSIVVVECVVVAQVCGCDSFFCGVAVIGGVVVVESIVVKLVVRLLISTV